jgi:molybdopterin/thiamine biosynthesis adenylyltransferase
VIDLDTVDVSNLNRQFLFRSTDIGKGKAESAANFIMKRCPNVKVEYSTDKIQTKGAKWYKQFQIVISGLDNVEARQWLNATLNSLVEYDADGNIDPDTVIPMIDGGTEGFRGQARVFLPKLTSCFECSLETMPQQQHFHMCTLASVPRIPEHCIMYIKEAVWPLLEDVTDVDNYTIAYQSAQGASPDDEVEDDSFPKEGTFWRAIVADSKVTISRGKFEQKNKYVPMQESEVTTQVHDCKDSAEAQKMIDDHLTQTRGKEVQSPTATNVKLDTDDSHHMSWIFNRSQDRASRFKIEGVTYKLTMQMVKNIIPAVAFTNAVIAAACVNEAVKFATRCNYVLDNYMAYNGVNLAGCNTFSYQKLPTCNVCRPPKFLKSARSDTISALLERVKEEFKLEHPSISSDSGVWFMAKLASSYAENLSKTIGDMVPADVDCTPLVVTDSDGFDETVMLTLS